MTLGEQIKQAREKKNLSQEDLAERIGVSRQAVSKWENDTSVPQGINREVLAEVLELEPIVTPEENIQEVNISEGKENRNIVSYAGWIVAAALLVLLVLVTSMWIYQGAGDKEDSYWMEAYDWAEASEVAESMVEALTQFTVTEGITNVEIVPKSTDTADSEKTVPRITNVVFYDKEYNKVYDEALWYNAARIDTILLQWEGGSAHSIKMFFVPSGTATLEQTELLATKMVLDGEHVMLLSAEALENIPNGDIYFEIDCGQDIITSDYINIFYDSSIIEE